MGSKSINTPHLCRSTCVCTKPSRSCPESDLPRQAWVKLKRLHLGVRRFINADMWRWDFFKSPACNCGADQQTVNHIITECPLYRPPWFPRLNWCWCRCSNSWVATKQVPRDLTISFSYLVSHARRRGVMMRGVALSVCIQRMWS